MIRIFKLVLIVCGLLLLAAYPAYAAGSVEIQPYFESGEGINDATGFRYHFYVVENEGRDYLKSIRGITEFKGNPSQNYLIETGVYSFGIDYSNYSCSDSQGLSGQTNPAEASLRIGLPYSTKSSLPGVKTNNPAIFPKVTYETETKGQSRAELVSQLNLNGKQGMIEISKGGPVTDKSGWLCEKDLEDIDYIQWNITTSIDAEERTMAIALPKDAASSLASGALLNIQAESLHSSGTFKIYYWGIEVRRSNGQWEGIDQWKVTSSDGSLTDYGARKVKYNDTTAIEISNDGSQGEFLAEGEVFSLSAPEDSAPPSGSLSINSGAEYANAKSLTLNLSAQDDTGITGYYLSEESSAPAKDKDGWVSLSPGTTYNVGITYSLKEETNAVNTLILYVWYKDAAGNISETASDSISFDLTAPSLTITSPTTASTFNTKEASLTLSGTASDNASGIEKITYTSAQGATGTAIGSTNWSIPSLKLSKGENLFTITAYDKLNNSAQASFTANCEVVDPPETPIFNQKYAGKAVNSGSLSWSWGPAESGGPVEEYWVSPSWLPNGFLTKETAYSPAKKLSKGTYWINILARNSAGISRKARDVIVIVDEKSDNKASSAIGSETSTTDTDVSGDTTKTSLASETASKNTDDDAENTVLDSNSDDAEDAVSAPTGAIDINDGEDYARSSAVAIFLLATDDMGVSAYYLSESSAVPKADGSGWSAITQSEEYSAEITYEMTGQEGEKYIYCWFKDGSGNMSEGSSDSIMLDKTSPEITITSHSSGDIKEASVNLSGSVSDNTEGSGVIKVTINNSLSLEEKTAGLDNDTWFAKLSLEKGGNVVTVTAEDAAGNTATQKITLDYDGQEEEETVSEANVRSDIKDRIRYIDELLVENQDSIDAFFNQDSSRWNNFIDYNGYFSAAFEGIDANGWDTTNISFSDEEKSYIFSELSDIIEKTSFLKDAKSIIDLETNPDNYRAAAIREIIYINLMDVYNSDFSKYKSDIAKVLALAEDRDSIISKVYEELNVLFIMGEKAYSSELLEARIYNLLQAVPGSLYSQPLVISARSENVSALIKDIEGGERGLARINVAADFDIKTVFHQVNSNIWDNIEKNDSQQEKEERIYELINRSGLQESNYLKTQPASQCGESAIFGGNSTYCFLLDSELKIAEEHILSCGYVSENDGQYCVDTNRITYENNPQSCGSCFIFYFISPREFLPYIADGWLNTENLFKSALASFNDEDDPRKEPMNQFLFFADIYSEDNETAKFYSSDEETSLSSQDIAISHDDDNQIVSLTIDKTEYTFTLDEDGNVDTISSSDVSPKEPSAETEGAEDVTDSSAKLQGKVNANNSETSAWFEYRREDEEDYHRSSAKQTVVGKTAKDISANISGLSSLTRYYYRLSVKNEEGIQYGEEKNFITLENLTSDETE